MIAAGDDSSWEIIATLGMIAAGGRMQLSTKSRAEADLSAIRALWRSEQHEPGDDPHGVPAHGSVGHLQAARGSEGSLGRHHQLLCLHKAHCTHENSQRVMGSVHVKLFLTVIWCPQILWYASCMCTDVQPPLVSCQPGLHLLMSWWHILLSVYSHRSAYGATPCAVVRAAKISSVFARHKLQLSAARRLCLYKPLVIVVAETGASPCEDNTLDHSIIVREGTAADDDSSICVEVAAVKECFASCTERSRVSTAYTTLLVCSHFDTDLLLSRVYDRDTDVTACNHA